MEGQAEVAAQRPAGSDDAVEILVGGTRAVSRSDADGLAHSRARHGDGGGAKVMVYEGGSEVESGGAKVEVGRGMGTSVEEGRPPKPPEELLPAPAGLLPAPGSSLQFNNVEFAWEAVADAASYTAELCLDPDCARLVDRRLALTEPAWTPPPLRRGDYYWRVTAVSASGLDGYPSAGARLAILADGADLGAPSGRLVVAGRQLRMEGRLYVDEAVRVEPQLEDSQSGVGGWRPVIDGRETDRRRWDGPWPDGTYAATVAAFDRVGNEARLPAVEFVVDATPPQLGARGEPSSGGVSAMPPRLRRLWLRRGRNWLEASIDGRLWLPWTVPGSPLDRELARRGVPGLSRLLVVNGDNPQVLVRLADGADLRPPSGPPAPMLVVWAADAGVGVERLELRLDEPVASRFAFRVTAADAFEHRRELSWTLNP